MTKFILHGGFASADNELNRSFFREIINSVPDGGVVLLVEFAGVGDTQENYFQNDKESFVRNASGKRLEFILATEEAFIDQLEEADAIFIRGGDTPKLLETMKKFPNFEKLIDGKVVAGSSAGAQVLSTYFHRSQTGEILEGLGIIPIRFAPHYKSDKFEFGDDAPEKLAKYPKELELVVLKDFEWRVFEK